MRSGRRWLLLVPALLAACGRPAPPEEALPLVDGLHQPLVLTESALLEMPPSWSGNRFVRGWWPGRRGLPPRQINVGDRVMLEAVFLDGRERRLSTRLEIVEAEPGATFGVRVAGVELPPQPLVSDAEVPLPGGLPLGRLPIELDLRGARVVIHAAGFGHAWPAGRVELGPESIIQEGYSAIDFPRRLGGPARVWGRFLAPPEPEEDQRFAALVESDTGGSRVAFEWVTGERLPAAGALFEVELPAGFVRLRLLAQGLGPAGRWQELLIAGGGADQAAEAVSLSTVPARDGTASVAASDRYELIRAPGLGMPGDADRSRDAEYVFDLQRDPERRRNLAGLRAVEIDWLRSRLEAWMTGGGAS